MMFFTMYVYMFMVQLGYVNPSACYPDTQVWAYSSPDNPVYIAGYTCRLDLPLRSRQR